MKAAYDFNYRQRLIKMAVRYANSPLEAVRRVVGAGLAEMLESDTRLEAAKDLVIEVGHLGQQAASSKGNRILHPELLQILLKLPVGRADDAELHGDPNLGHADDDLRRNLQESSIHQGVAKLRKGEAELLYEVFCVYLRIIRQRGTHSQELIAAALSGLAKWGQQVNLELLIEILRELKLTVQEAVGRMDEIVALQGLHCALVLLSGPAKALVTDATWIPDALTGALAVALPSLYSVHSEGYRGWPPVGTYVLDDDKLCVNAKELASSLQENSMPFLMLRCLGAAMMCSHGFGGASDGALAALLEQLGLLAAGADPHVSVAILKEMADLLKKHRKLHTLLDVEGGLFGLGGITDRALSVAWPLHALAASLAPAPAKVGQQLAAMVSSRRGLLSDVFPFRDSKAWLESEFPRHLTSLLEVQRPALLAAVAARPQPVSDAEESEDGEGEDAGESGGKHRGKGRKGAGKGGDDATWGGTTLAEGAISKKKRRRVVFWSEAQLRRAVLRSEGP